MRIVEAVARFREAGWNETTGFGARDVARLMKGLEPVIADELELLIERFSALGPERAEDIVEGGASPFPALIGALHAKLLTAELERGRGRRLATGAQLREALGSRASPARSRARRAPWRCRSCTPARRARPRTGSAAARRRAAAAARRASEAAAIGPATGAGTDRVGGSTPWVSSSAETNSRNTTRSPSVTK